MKIFNKWRVIGDETIINNNKFLPCRCECGNEKLVRVKNLKSGISKNCGCVRNKRTIQRNTTHGKRYNKIWSVWNCMKQRCYNNNNKGYKNYGGRGIAVCDEWKNNFMSFLKDMGDVPVNMSIDRINNNGNYCKENCKWSTKTEQNRNRRSNIKIDGVCISIISKELGGANSLVSKRLKRGWSIKKAITLKSNDRV